MVHNPITDAFQIKNNNKMIIIIVYDEMKPNDVS